MSDTELVLGDAKMYTLSYTEAHRIKGITDNIDRLVKKKKNMPDYKYYRVQDIFGKLVDRMSD